MRRHRLHDMTLGQFLDVERRIEDSLLRLHEAEIDWPDRIDHLADVPLWVYERAER